MNVSKQSLASVNKCEQIPSTWTKMSGLVHDGRWLQPSRETPLHHLRQLDYFKSAKKRIATIRKPRPMPQQPKTIGCVDWVPRQGATAAGVAAAAGATTVGTVSRLGMLNSIQ